MKGLEIIEEIPIMETPVWTLLVMVCGVFLILIPTYITYRKTKDWEKHLKQKLFPCNLYGYIFICNVTNSCKWCV